MNQPWCMSTFTPDKAHQWVRMRIKAPRRLLPPPVQSLLSLAPPHPLCWSCLPLVSGILCVLFLLSRHSSLLFASLTPLSQPPLWPQSPPSSVKLSLPSPWTQLSRVHAAATLPPADGLWGQVTSVFYILSATCFCLGEPHRPCRGWVSWTRHPHCPKFLTVNLHNKSVQRTHCPTILWMRRLRLRDSLSQSMAGTSLVAQWLRICPPRQRTQVRSLVREDPTHHAATKPVCHMYWAYTPGACALKQEKPLQWRVHALQGRVALTCCN